MLNSYHNAIRQHLYELDQTANLQRLIVWEIQEDEAKDPTLLSLRLYGSREYADVVMVACGTNGIWEKLPMDTVLFPTLQDIIKLRKIYVENNPYA